MATESDALWLHAHTHVSIVELAECSGLPESLLRELVEYGALTPADAQAGLFSSECVVSVRTAARLRHDLELETPALALVLSLLERLHRLDAEVRHLSAQVSRPQR